MDKRRAIQRANFLRANHAKAAFEACGLHDHSDLADHITNLICDLGHLANRSGHDYLRLIARGLTHWSAEQRHPDGLEAVTGAQFVIAEKASRPNTDLLAKLSTLKSSCEEALDGTWDRSDDGFEAMLAPALSCQSFPLTMAAVGSGRFASIVPE